MEDSRGALGEMFAHQILSTVRPYMTKPFQQADVLDVGCGYGHTALQLAKVCRMVRGIEPSTPLHRVAQRLAAESARTNIQVDPLDVYELDAEASYDLVVLDNVYEHLHDQTRAMDILVRCLRPGGVLFLLTPNRLWPIEAHYRLPFLAYLPLGWANRYLRLTRRGFDFTDASYSPTMFSLRRTLDAQACLDWQLTLPAHSGATMSGSPLHYRIGMRILRWAPSLWVISKSFLVVGVKTDK